MVLFAALWILTLSLGTFWLSGRYISFFGVNIRTVKWRLIRAAAAVLLSALCLIIRIGMLFLLHLLVLFGLGELIVRLVKLFWKKRTPTKAYNTVKKIYRSGILPIILVAAFFIWGYFNMNRVVETRYTVQSAELSQNYRVVFLSDTHYGTIQDKELLKEKVMEINKLRPDIVILGGDIVEEGTSNAEMHEVFDTLSRIDSRYGTYFVYGNHDRQRYTSDPEYTEAELADVIALSGIKILNDEYVEINGDLLLVGREDLSAAETRADNEALLNGADTDKFMLVADHQPSDNKNNAALGADLQLSGHTHGGQIFPLGFMPFFYKGLVYGEYREGDSTIIVSSGFAGWGFPIRTQGVCEYVVVDLIAE